MRAVTGISWRASNRAAASALHYADREDCAVQVVSKPPHETLWAISTDYGADEALKKMSGLGVGALLVINHYFVVGLITAEDIRRRRGVPGVDQRVADVMTDAGHVPLLGWQTVLESSLNDVLQIFESTRTNHLVVVQSEDSDFTRVRGLIYRRQLRRQLGAFPNLDWSLELDLPPAAPAITDSRASRALSA
jgi:predicted transcriptional regulator